MFTSIQRRVIWEWFRYNNVWENLRDYFRSCKYGRTSTLTDNQLKKKKLKYTKWSLPFPEIVVFNKTKSDFLKCNKQIYIYIY